MRETRRVKYRVDSSMLHSLHPVVKLVCFALSVAAALCAKSALALAVAAAYTAAVVYLSQLDKEDIISSVKTMAFFLILVIFVNTCFAFPQYARFRRLFFAPSLFGAQRGLFVALKSLIAVLLCDVLSCTTPTAEMTGAFAILLSPLRFVGIPTAQTAFILTEAVDFIPFLLSETERIRFAQRARGAAAENGKFTSKAENALRCFLPLLASAFKRAEKLSLSMEARGGSAEAAFLPDGNLNRNDISALVVCFAVFIMQLIIL